MISQGSRFFRDLLIELARKIDQKIHLDRFLSIHHYIFLV